MNLSVVIPLLNEEESLKELHHWIAQVMQSNGFSYEILFIDDGSTDASWQIISKLAATHPQVKGIRFLKNYGKSQALHAGFLHAQGEVVVTMDADLQDSPDEIPELYRMVHDENYDLVSGWKKIRHDAKFTKNLPSKLFNLAARKTSGLRLHDFNCGLKAYKNEVIKNIDVTGEMHRYIPVLVKNAGYKNITEKAVLHQARKYGKTKFGISRFTNGLLDLITIWFLSKFGRRPMHFFGLFGLIIFFIGFCLTAYLGIDKLFINPTGRLITERPEFFISLVTIIVGTQLFLAGFLGEMILKPRNSSENYRIHETIG